MRTVSDEDKRPEPRAADRWHVDHCPRCDRTAGNPCARECRERWRVLDEMARKRKGAAS